MLVGVRGVDPPADSRAAEGLLAGPSRGRRCTPACGVRRLRGARAAAGL